MIRVVGANPAMDRISTWPPLSLAGVNRAATVSVVPGGKGVNVARAAVRLGERAVIYGFLGGHVGEALHEMISADGVTDRHTAIAGGTRVCFIVVEPGIGRSTVLNEPGPEVTTEEVARLLDELRADSQPGDLVVLSGSLPDSVAPTVAGAIVKIGNDAGARTIVDIHGEALREAVSRRPWMLKCNRRELLQLLGAAESDVPISVPELAGEMRRVRERGIEIVVVTLGAEGALLADADGVVHARVPAIDEVNPTGSGDLLLAGLAVGIERGQEARHAIVLGAACGTAGATHLPPELPPDFDAAARSADISVEIVEPL
jgi:1-phosphofructokinase family hexose kinase